MIAATCPRHGTRLTQYGYMMVCFEPGCSYGVAITALDPNPDAKPIKAKVIEKDLQAEVIQRLGFAGYEVMETGKPHGGQKCDKCGNVLRHPGWQGNTPGIPDLFIRGKQWPVGVWLGVELKGSTTPISDDQQALCDRGGSYICWTWEEVWTAVLATQDSITEARLAKVGTATVNRLREEKGL